MTKKPLYVSVDVETTGPCPGLYSMIELGACVVEQDFDTIGSRTFLTQIKPIDFAVGLVYDKEALAAIGRNWEDVLDYPTMPDLAIQNFWIWCTSLSEDRKLVFASDNNGFDWQFVNYYFHRYCSYNPFDPSSTNTNPFGYSSLNINSLYKGLRKDMKANISGLRKTEHTHNALDDAKGNAEALHQVLFLMDNL